MLSTTVQSVQRLFGYELGRSLAGTVEMMSQQIIDLPPGKEKQLHGAALLHYACQCCKDSRVYFSFHSKSRNRFMFFGRFLVIVYPNENEHQRRENVVN